MEPLREMIRELVYEKLRKELAGCLEGISVLAAFAAMRQTKEDVTYKYEDSLLTEAAVKSAAENGNKDMLIGKKCLITPLAMDCVRENEIRIRRVGDADGCG